MGTERFSADLVEITGPDAQRAIDLQAQASEQFTAYLERAAPRAIPVFSIDRA